MASNAMLAAIASRKVTAPVRKRVPPVPRYPMAVEREYQRQLNIYVKVFLQAVQDIIVPSLDSLVAQAGMYRPDASELRVDTWAEDLEQLVNATTIAFERRAISPQDIVGSTAAGVATQNKEQLNRAMRAAAGVDVFISEPYLADALTNFRVQNVKLIKNITSNELTQIEGVIQRGLQQGWTGNQIAIEIKERTGIPRRRANLIARDQVASLNGELTTLRGRELGVKTAVWMTSMDERVRPEHAARQGQVYDLDTGIDGDWPGTPINCRCVAQLNLDSLLEQV